MTRNELSLLILAVVERGWREIETGDSVQVATRKIQMCVVALLDDVGLLPKK